MIFLDLKAPLDCVFDLRLFLEWWECRDLRLFLDLDFPSEFFLESEPWFGLLDLKPEREGLLILLLLRALEILDTCPKFEFELNLESLDPDLLSLLLLLVLIAIAIPRQRLQTNMMSNKIRTIINQGVFFFGEPLN